MRKFGNVAVVPALVAAIVATGVQTAAAQQECEIDENSGGLAVPVFSLMAAQSPGVAQAEQSKKLAEAIGRMFPGDPKREEQDNSRNPVGRAFVLGKIYMVYLSQPDMPVVTTRGQLGFKSNPEGAADLSVGIDSAFRIVEEKMPQCATLTSQWRQQAGWVKLVQSAMDLANENKVDSAEAVAQQALRISPTAPYSRLVLGNVAAQRSKHMEAIEQYKAALVEAEKDTIFADVRRTILYTLGTYGNDAAQVDTNKANQKVYLTEALAAFEALANDPGGKYAEVASQGRTAVLRTMGDTAAIKNACAPTVANPGAARFIELIQCGVTLAEVNDVENSMKLFEAAATQNPYHRDALYNLARQQLVANRIKEAIATTDKLVALDPSNPENLKLYVFAYNALRNEYRNAADSIGRAVNALPRTTANQAKRTAMTNEAIRLDSLIKFNTNLVVDWNTKADQMPVKVIFAEFTPLADKATLAGEIQNRSDSVKTFTLNIEFLDKAGAVVGQGSATVENVAPKSSTRFSITGTAAGIVAFRYKPIM